MDPQAVAAAVRWLDFSEQSKQWQKKEKENQTNKQINTSCVVTRAQGRLNTHKSVSPNVHFYTKALKPHVILY